MMQEFQVDTRNLTITGLACGDLAAPPVLALHGWLDNAASFLPLAQHLNGLRLIALDLPGHGKSAHRSGISGYHFIDYATDVVLTANALGIEKFRLLGHSLGAAISAVVAGTHPDRVEKLAMVDGLVPMTGEPSQVPAQLRQHMDTVAKAPSEGSKFENIMQAAKSRKNAGDLSLDAARLIAERNLQATPAGYVWRTDRLLKKPTAVYLDKLQVQAYLRTIECDARLIRSSDGIVKNWPALSGYEKYVKNLQVMDIAGNHHCHMDYPARVAEHLQPFLTN